MVWQPDLLNLLVSASEEEEEQNPQLIMKYRRAASSVHRQPQHHATGRFAGFGKNMPTQAVPK